MLIIAEDQSSLVRFVSNTSVLMRRLRTDS